MTSSSSSLKGNVSQQIFIKDNNNLCHYQHETSKRKETMNKPIPEISTKTSQGKMKYEGVCSSINSSLYIIGRCTKISFSVTQTA